MEDDEIYKSLSVVSLLGILVLLLLLINFDNKSAFTELYFDNIDSIPDSIKQNKIYEFSFVVHNLEGKKTSYPYIIYLETYNLNILKSKRVLAQGTINLENNEKISIPLTFSVVEDFTKAVILVNLPDQYIYFEVENDN